MVIDESFTNISLNQSSGNVTCGKLRLRGTQENEEERTKRTKITLRLSNKYDFKHRNYCAESFEPFDEESITENRATLITKVETKENQPNLQDFGKDVKVSHLNVLNSTSDGELEELNKNVLLNTLILVKKLWLVGMMIIFF